MTRTYSFQEGNAMREVSFPSSIFVPLVRMTVVTEPKAIKWKVSYHEEREVVEPTLVKRKRKDNFSLILDPEYF